MCLKYVLLKLLQLRVLGLVFSKSGNFSLYDVSVERKWYMYRLGVLVYMYVYVCVYGFRQEDEVT